MLFAIQYRAFASLALLLAGEGVPTMPPRWGLLPAANPATISTPRPPRSVSHPYAQGPDGTYSNPLGGPDHELGDSDPTQPVTRIDARGGRIVFEGLYHVVGPVEFVNGKFELTPGTVFYVEGGKGPSGSWPVVPQGQQCYADVLGGDHFIQLFVGQDATLVLDGATLTADCDEMWGGVELVDNGTLYTQTSAGSKQRARISEARVGVLLGTPCRSDGAAYYLTSTDFYNDTYGVVALGNDHLMGTSCRVTDCHFSSDHTQRLWPDNSSTYGGGDYTQAGLVLRGEWHQNIPYQDNSFEELLVGAELAANELLFDHNTFAYCYGVGIRVGAPNTGLFSSDLRVHGNTIDVPDTPAPGGQVDPGAAVTGIELTDMRQNYLSGNELRIESNRISSASAPRPSPAKLRVGVEGYLSFAHTFIEHANLFSSLEIGVRLMDASSQTIESQTVADNRFESCSQGIALRGAQYALFSPTLACNELENDDYGIYIESGADVGDLGTQDEPCGNVYNAVGTTVENNGANPINYYYDFDRGEVANFSPFFQITAMPVFGAPGCAARNFNNHGLQRGSAPVTTTPVGGTGSTPLQQWQSQLLTQQGSLKTLHQVERQLLRGYRTSQQWAGLETFAASLALRNPASYQRLSLYLMETYRRQGQAAAAQRVRAHLLRFAGTDAQVRRRVDYFDVAGRLRTLAPGQRPTPADSAVLVAVAGSATGIAPVACATLRYFYPQLSCGTVAGSQPGQARAAAKLAATASRLRPAVQVVAAPNPATETVRVEATGLAELTGNHLELVEMATGRVVLRQPFAAEMAGVSITVRGLASGVYAGRLLHGEVLLGTCKIVVLH